MLFFHQQVKFVKPVHYGAVLLLIITERLSETNESKAAFVFNIVAHDVVPIAIGRAAKLVYYKGAAKKNPPVKPGDKNNLYEQNYNPLKFKPI
jgi:hypothetical protein